MQMNELIIYAGNTGGVVIASKSTGRSCIIVDEDATEEEVQDTIRWAREELEKDKLPSALEFFSLINNGTRET